MENNVATEVHIKRCKSKKVGINELQSAFVYPGAEPEQEVQRVERFDGEGRFFYSELQNFWDEK